MERFEQCHVSRSTEKNLECPPCFGHGAYGRLYVVCWRQANVEFWSCLLPKIHNSNLNTHTQTYTHCSYLLREKEIQIDLCEYIRITVYIWLHIVCVFKENYKFPNDVLQHEHVRMSDSRKIVVYSLSFWGGKIITQNFFKCTIGTTCVTLLVVVSGEIVSEHFEERMFTNMRKYLVRKDLNCNFDKSRLIVMDLVGIVNIYTMYSLESLIVLDYLCTWNFWQMSYILTTI